MKEGDWVITSRGRYGKILTLNKDKDTAIVKIGTNAIEIALEQLSLSKDGTLFMVTYIVIGEHTETKQSVFVKRDTCLFDITTSNVDFYTTIKGLLVTKIKKDLRITKILIA